MFQTLLERDRSKESSDTTSGCDSGRQSEQGISINSLERSNSSQADTDHELQHEVTGDHDDQAEHGLAPVPGLTGYSQVKSMQNELGYINHSAPQASSSKPSPGYIQLPVASSLPPPAQPSSHPVSSGYIQIQNISPGLGSSAPPVASVLNLSPVTPQDLVRHSEENPSYSRITLLDPPPDQVKTQSSTTPGYIQFPSTTHNPVLISPNKLESKSSPRSNEPHNTKV